MLPHLADLIITVCSGCILIYPDCENLLLPCFCLNRSSCLSSLTSRVVWWNDMVETFPVTKPKKKKRLQSPSLLLWIHFADDVLFALAASGQVFFLPHPVGVCVFPHLFFLNTCGVSSPTRVKSRRTLLSYTGGIVTLPCPVTTRSSVPGSTARATSPGYRSPPPHQL